MQHVTMSGLQHQPNLHSAAVEQVSWHTRTSEGLTLRLPAEVLPARPALWLADALLTGVITKDSIPVRGLYEFCLANPGSMTYLQCTSST
jgi:hypothetical protein